MANARFTYGFQYLGCRVNCKALHACTEVWDNSSRVHHLCSICNHKFRPWALQQNFENPFAWGKLTKVQESPRENCLNHRLLEWWDTRQHHNGVGGFAGHYSRCHQWHQGTGHRWGRVLTPRAGMDARCNAARQQQQLTQYNTSTRAIA